MLINEEEIFEVRLTKADGYKKIGIGLGVIFVTLSCLVWFYFPLYKNPVTSNIIFFVFLKVVAILISALSLLKLICMFAFLIIETGINETKYIRKYGGILYRMDSQGLSYHEKGFLIVRGWSEVIDVGLFRQMESEVIYNYQMKFSDGDRHTFDLRGNYPTIAFKEKIEEFWFKYNS
ncbi:hypothetical protein HMPREF9510_00183 [Enterococcus faecalis TX0470]|nr:hypothetical protein HMPREF9510_00183 [Enterococcus faecalis TX0470]